MSVKESVEKEKRTRIETIEPQVEQALEITQAVLIEGKAGVGKTSLLEHIAEKNGWVKIFYQAHPKTSSEELLYQLLPSEETNSGIALIPGVLVQALKSAQTRRTLLVLDEWDKTKPSLDAFMLDFLQNKRLSIPNFEIELPPEKWNNLMVGFTSNGEREMSEPFLRRVAVFRMAPLRPEKVLSLLSQKHKENPYLLSAIKLYVMTHYAELPKPATIQELDQLLTAISLNPKNADWNSLVFTYVTKTPEVHEILADISRRELKLKEMIAHVWGEGPQFNSDPSFQITASLNTESFSGSEEDLATIESESENNGIPRLPRGYLMLSNTEAETEKEEIPEEEFNQSSFIAKVRTPEIYDAVISTLFEDDPSAFKSQSNTILVSRKKLNISKAKDRAKLYALMESLDKHKRDIQGELLVSFPCRGLSKQEIFETLRNHDFKLGKLMRGGAVFVLPVTDDPDNSVFACEIAVKGYGATASIEAIINLAYTDAIKKLLKASEALIKEAQLKQPQEDIKTGEKEREEEKVNIGLISPKQLEKGYKILNQCELFEITDDTLKREVAEILASPEFQREEERIREAVETAIDICFKHQLNLHEKVKEIVSQYGSFDYSRLKLLKNDETFRKLYEGLLALLGTHFLYPANAKEDLPSRTLTETLHSAEYNTAVENTWNPNNDASYLTLYNLAYMAWLSHMLRGMPLKDFWKELSIHGKEEFIKTLYHMRVKMELPMDYPLHPLTLDLPESKFIYVYAKNPTSAIMRSAGYQIFSYITDNWDIPITGNIDIDERSGSIDTPQELTSLFGTTCPSFRWENTDKTQLILTVPIMPVFYRSYYTKGEKWTQGFSILNPCLGSQKQYLLNKELQFFRELEEQFASEGLECESYHFDTVFSAYKKTIHSRAIPTAEGEKPSGANVATFDSILRRAIQKVGLMMNREELTSFIKARELANTLWLLNFHARRTKQEHILEKVRFNIPEECKKEYTKETMKELVGLRQQDTKQKISSKQSRRRVAP